MDKLKMQSPNLVDTNIDKIAALFPNCITEDRDENGIVRRAVDFDLLHQELSANLVEGPQERYTLNWPGKNEAILTANAPIAKTLRPCEEESVDFENTRNIYIEGDNLDALKLLQETYLNKVKMIYIDPPYNTGNDFIYEDDFAEDTEAFLQRSNQKDEEGNRLVANTEANGRFHSDWLTMIYPRLKLARNLLREDGVIFISIDDNEVHNLRKVCDEIFGEGGVLVPFIWSLPRGINAGHISRAHEYIVGYAKNKDSLGHFLKTGSHEYSIERCNKKIEARHPASPINFPLGIPYEGEDKEIEGIIEGSEEIKIEGKLVFKNGRLAQNVTLVAGWTMKQMILDWLSGKEVVDTKGQKIESFFFKNNGKLYSKKIALFQSPKSLLSDIPDTQVARIEMEGILGNQDIFPYPKPSQLIKRLAQFVLSNNDICLDFFSGSCPTAHAVMQLNAEDGGNRKYIMVQLPEPCNEKSEAFKAGYKTIAEIGKERIRRAGKKIKEENGEKAQNLDTGFRVFKVDTSNMKDVYYTPDELKQGKLDLFKDHIRPDRHSEDLLFQVFIDWGLDLALPIAKETIDGKTIFFVDADALIACFDSGITEELVKKLAKHKPLRVVFRDDAFGSDSVKINVEQIFKMLSPGTEVKSI